MKKSRKEISSSDNLARFLTALAAIAAIILLMLMLFIRLAKVLEMGIDTQVLDTLEFIELVGAMVVVIVVAIQACIKQGFIAFLVVGVIAAAIVVLTFFPAVTDKFFNTAAMLLR